MSFDSNEFTTLRPWLALKRHEVPPPGFFDRFPSQVISRIEAEREQAPASWRERWSFAWDLKPALVSACGLVVCGMLATGIIVASQPRESRPTAWSTPQPNLTEVERVQIPWRAVLLEPASIPESTAPVFAQPSPFSQFIPRAERVRFNVMLTGH